MSLNWREITLILEELPLTGSSLQRTTQHDFHSLSWHFYHPDAGRWTLYTEVGTPFSRLHELKRPISENQLGKTAKLQRFNQFCRANLEGAKVESVYQQPYDRVVLLRMNNHGRILHLYLRFYSGPGANILVTDENDILLDLLYRRPGREEQSGERFCLPEPRKDEGKPFLARERHGNSFNAQIEEEYGEKSNFLTLEELIKRVERKKERELKSMNTTLASLVRTSMSTMNYQHFRKLGDLLSANQQLLIDKMGHITLEDWETGEPITIDLDEKLMARENIHLYYEKYQKAKRTHENAIQEIEKTRDLIAHREAHYASLLNPERDPIVAIKSLKKELDDAPEPQQQKTQSPGLTIQSGVFTLLVGRNARENDALLRHYVKGNDYWMHTRDVPGGYVFIKFIRGKSIPLDVLLDAANLALVFSKAKNQGHADLYYTQVKHLRRAKGGKTGLVLPTQEKNLTVTLDEERLSRLLLGHEYT
ncbi:MAG: NFACT RNA binding domain-containing protein [Sphaerochaetaceae bacterium]